MRKPRQEGAILFPGCLIHYVPWAAVPREHRSLTTLCCLSIWLLKLLGPQGTCPENFTFLRDRLQMYSESKSPIAFGLRAPLVSSALSTPAFPWMHREENKLQALFTILFASFKRNIGKLFLYFFSSQIPQLLEQNTAENLAVSPLASVGASVKGHPRTTCSPLPEKRMLWASVAVHIAPLYCHSFPILLVNPMKKRVSLFEQKDTKATMPSSPVGDRNLWAQEGGQGVLLRSLVLPHPHSAFIPGILSSPLFMTCSPKMFHLSHTSPLSSVLSSLPIDCLTLLVCSCVYSSGVCLCTHSLPSTTYTATTGAMYIWVKNSNMSELGVVCRRFYTLLEDFCPQRDAYHTLPMNLSSYLEELSRKANVIEPVLNLISKLPNRS